MVLGDKMKKYFILIILLCLTGCTCDYEIRIDGDDIHESMKSNIYPDDYEAVYPDIESDDLVRYLVESDIYPLINSNSEIYEKNVNNVDNYQELDMYYKYNKNDFKDYGYVLNNCFEKKVVSFDNKKIYVHLTGNFYCLYNDEVNITVKADKHFNKANGLKVDDGYKWTINENNYQNIDIEMELSSLSNTRYTVYIVAAIILSVIFGIVILYIIFKINSVGRVNDI